MSKIHTTIQPTRLAPLFIAVDDAQRLVLMRFLDPGEGSKDVEDLTAGLRAAGHEVVEGPRQCAAVVRAVKDFVAKKSRTIDVPIAPQGTAFQNKVWKAVAKIGYGKTLSYKQLAQRIGRPTAVRAVARANATNPCALVVPCHRVIGSDGKATGYNGGIAVKEALLALEADS